jgi:ankyrin repeat protein
MKNIFLPAVAAFFACACGSAPALYQAAGSGNTAQINALLSAGGNPNEQFRNWKNLTALHKAAASGQVEAARLLLERGADPNLQALSPVPFHKPHNRGTALHFAACTGNTGMVRLLLEKGADPEPCIGECEHPLRNGFLGGWESGTPLQLAGYHGHAEVAGILKAAIAAKAGRVAPEGSNGAGSYGAMLAELLSGCDTAGKTVAVADFSYADGRASSDGKVLAVRVASELIKLRRLKVVEREQLQKVLAELKLQSSGAVDQASAKKLGRVLGADLLVVGSLDELPGELLEVNLRLADVESGQALSAASGQVRKDWVN